jgi:hypothetical protein
MYKEMNVAEAEGVCVWIRSEGVFARSQEEEKSKE